MSDGDHTNEAYEAIGRYWCIFSELEYQLGETVKVIFKVHDHEAADAIVALADFVKKVNLVSSAVQFARRFSGEELSAEWKEAAQKTLNEILGVNTGERVELAHSRLRPQTDGSVQITRLTASGVLKINEKNWSQTDFRQKCARLERLIGEVKAIRKALMTVLLYARSGAYAKDIGYLLAHA